MPKLNIHRIREDNENLYQLVDVLQVLKLGVDTYKAGANSSWMIVSARLHSLLTDTSKGNSPLALRVIEDLDFHPMLLDISRSDDLLYSPVAIKGRDLKIFDLSKPKIPLGAWLEQTAYIQHYKGKGIPISIDDLIRQPRHQAGGVHFDTKLRQEMAVIEGILSFARLVDGSLSFRDYVVAIGEYVHWELNSTLTGSLGNGYLSTGDLPKAAQFISSALSACKSVGNIHGTCEQLQNLGYLQYHQGDLRQALRSYQEAFELAAELERLDIKNKVASDLTIIWLQLGNSCFDAGEFIQSTEAYMAGATYALNYDNVPHLIIHLSNLAKAYLQLGDTYSAVSAWLLASLVQIDEKTIASCTTDPLSPILAKIALGLHEVQQREDNIADLINELVSGPLRHLAIRLGPGHFALTSPDVVKTRASEFISKWLEAG